MKVFDIKFDKTVDEIGYEGYGRVTCKVHGYWSQDSITLYIERRYGSEWMVKLSHAAGGRDTKEVESDMDAAANFGQAMIAMAREGKSYEACFEIMEEAYQRKLADQKAEREAAEAVKQAKFDADEKLGVVGATLLVDLMARGHVVSVYNRGEDRVVPASCSVRGNTTFYYCGQRIAKKELIRILALSSHRSRVMEKA